MMSCDGVYGQVGRRTQLKYTFTTSRSLNNQGTVDNCPKLKKSGSRPQVSVAVHPYIYIYVEVPYLAPGDVKTCPSSPRATLQYNMFGRE